MTYHEMTPQALALRADEMADAGPLGPHLGRIDDRALTLFFEHVDCDITDYLDLGPVYGLSRELIGVTLDEDALTRDEARAMFGDARVTEWEGDAWDTDDEDNHDED